MKTQTFPKRTIFKTTTSKLRITGFVKLDHKERKWFRIIGGAWLYKYARYRDATKTEIKNFKRKWKEYAQESTI